jgi:2-polyprenyl-3-methyl-5-hydroxy-6-metoxy-1,4-benzoquinol methylase
MNVASVYKNRFSRNENDNRRRLWQVLTDRVLSRFIHPSDTVIDLGAGGGEFLSSITAAKKIAVDPISPKYLTKNGITLVPVSILKTPKRLYGTADVVMISNTLEHLKNAEELVTTLAIARKLLNTGGRLVIIQPTLDLTHTHYYDFVDHQVPITRSSLLEALSLVGFTVTTYVPRFLPYTTKSRLPKTDVLLHVYLSIPWYLRPMAGQCFIVAAKSR